jgi:hypothetical protein
MHLELKHAERESDVQIPHEAILIPYVYTENE